MLRLLERYHLQQRLNMAEEDNERLLNCCNEQQARIATLEADRDQQLSQASHGAVRVTWIDILREWFEGERYARDYEYLDANYRPHAERVVSYLASLEPAAPGREEAGEGAMSPEEIRLENLKQMADYSGPIVCFEVREPYYLASCDHCGWVGSSEACGSDSFGDDSDVYCPRCFASGADCGKIAARLASPPTGKDAVQAVTEEDMWTGEGDGFKSFTLSAKVAERWRKSGMKVTPYAALQQKETGR